MSGNNAPMTDNFLVRALLDKDADLALDIQIKRRLLKGFSVEASGFKSTVTLVFEADTETINRLQILTGDTSVLERQLRDERSKAKKLEAPKPPTPKYLEDKT